MPSLGADMEAGTLVQWLKHPGDPVKRGDIIAVVDTQKGAIEVEVFEDGIVDRLVIEPGARVPVGELLAVIRGAAEPSPAPAVVREPSPKQMPAAVTPSVAPAPPPGGERRRISPAARTFAEKIGIDLSQVQGSGPDGAMTREDVERAAAARTEPRLPVPPDHRTAMRQAVGAAMARAKREIPHFYLSETVDLSAAQAWLARENERRPLPERLLPAVLLLKATARALREVPDLNGFWIDGAFRPGTGVHVGWAISLRGGGLVAPAVHDADVKSIDVLMRELRDLVARARAGSLRSSELTDSTFTVTSLGDQGVETAYGIIYPPQVGILAFGRISPGPWVVGDRVEPRPLMTASLSADHRAVDGHRGGLFLTAVGRCLQDPSAL